MLRIIWRESMIFLGIATAIAVALMLGAAGAVALDLVRAESDMGTRETMALALVLLSCGVLAFLLKAQK